MSIGARNADFRYVHRHKPVEHVPAGISMPEQDLLVCGYQVCFVGMTYQSAVSFAYNTWAPMVCVCKPQHMQIKVITMYRRGEHVIVNADKHELEARDIEPLRQTKWLELEKIGLPLDGTNLYDLEKLPEVCVELHRQKRLYLQTIRRTV